MTEKRVRLFLRVLMWTLLAVSLLLFAIFAARISGLESTASKTEQAALANTLIIWTYILIGVATFFTLLFPLLFIVQNPRKAVKLLVSLAFLFVVFGVSYLLADATPIITATSGVNPDFSDRFVLLLTDTGIIGTYILIAIALLLLVFTGVRNILTR